MEIQSLKKLLMESLQLSEMSMSSTLTSSLNGAQLFLHMLHFSLMSSLGELNIRSKLTKSSKNFVTSYSSIKRHNFNNDLIFLNISVNKNAIFQPAVEALKRNCHTITTISQFSVSLMHVQTHMNKAFFE